MARKFAIALACLPLLSGCDRGTLPSKVFERHSDRSAQDISACMDTDFGSRIFAGLHRVGVVARGGKPAIFLFTANRQNTRIAVITKDTRQTVIVRSLVPLTIFQKRLLAACMADRPSPRHPSANEALLS